jgi:hypothetical protein
VSDDRITLDELGDTSPERMYLTERLRRAVTAVEDPDRPLTARLSYAFLNGLSMLRPESFPDDEGRALFVSIFEDLNRYGELADGEGSLPTTLGTMSDENAQALAARIIRLAKMYGEV